MNQTGRVLGGEIYLAARDVLVMSIDPQGCEDVDDTISIHQLDNGNLQVRIRGEYP